MTGLLIIIVAYLLIAILLVLGCTWLARGWQLRQAARDIERRRSPEYRYPSWRWPRR